MWRFIWFVITNPLWDIRHFFSPDWVAWFADKSRHLYWADYGVKTLSGLTVVILGSFYVQFRIWLWSKTGLRIGASWRFNQRGTTLELHPVVNIVTWVKNQWSTERIVQSIWVRERGEPTNPGNIHGHIDFSGLVDQKQKIPIEDRTTGGDPINLNGPTMTCVNASSIWGKDGKFDEEAEKIINCPIWIQWSDGTFSKAMSSGGNEPSLLMRLYTSWRFRQPWYKRFSWFSLKLLKPTDKTK